VWTKQTIDALKASDLPALYRLIEMGKNNKALLFLLENLGHLPDNFDGAALLPLLDHDHAAIRYEAVKNLAKLGDFAYVPRLFQLATRDSDSMVRREAASALGRMRDEGAIPYLSELLADADPKVVLQAVRGLLVFKERPRIIAQLKLLRDHPNETIQAVIEKEFFPATAAARLFPLAGIDVRNLIAAGDVRDTLQIVADESIHLTFTSPPYYNARDYSIYASYQAYLDFLTDVFRAVHRITKEGRFLVVNTSPVIVPRVSRAHASTRYPIPFDLHARLTEIGWEFIDDIIWAKPEASVKNRNGGFMQHRKPLAYKPNPVTEYVMVYRKKTDKLIDWNIRQYDDETVNDSKINDDYESSNLWQIDPTFDRVHSAVFPAELCRRVIQFYSYVGDVVFDPFAGSGTVGRAALALGRQFFLTERDSTYVERIRQSLDGGMFSQTRYLSARAVQSIVEQMPMRLTDVVIQNVIMKLLHGQDYRTEILALINAQFLQYVIEFFGKVVQAKFRNEGIDGDWYKREFLLDPALTSDEIIINAGLNKKTIDNQYGSSSRRVVLEVTPAYYDDLYRAISTLADASDDLDVTLTLRFRGVSIDLNLTESLIVINTLAVKRAQLRGGAWSTAGKRVEKYLMLTLCDLFSVPAADYDLRGLTAQKREVDFFVIGGDGRRYACEVKLMGKGNPESADAVIARDSHIFIADMLSALNKTQLDARGVQWVELRAPEGYRKWYAVLSALGVPARAFTGDLAAALPAVFARLFPPDAPIIPDIDLDGPPSE